MATPPAVVRDYCSLLVKSKLLQASEIDFLQQKWKDETQGTEEQLDAFSKYIVNKRVITSWQSAMVQRGRADGFFLDGYKILDQIGKGQMGGVYKAVHSLGQIVALKILPASRAKDQRVLGRFQREARLLIQLDHPNVVRAFQVGEAGGRHYIVMEFIEGETLDDVLNRRKRLPIGEAVRLVRQTLDGLEHLNDRRMIHRDLKPSNLMITPGGVESTWQATIKILDIGLGRELFDEDAPAAQVETQLTVEGSVVGTPDYMAPEQARDARSSDIRADIYSLGCVFYRCVTGQPPFPDTNIMTQMLRHATEDPQPLAKIVENVPPGLQQILDGFLAKSPAKRYQTPAAGSQALARYQTPGAGTNPSGVELVPAYRKFLESESNLELPKVVQPAPGPEPTAPTPGRGTEPKKSDRTSSTVKPGTATSKPLQSPSKANPPPTRTEIPPAPPQSPPTPAYPPPSQAIPSWQPAARASGMSLPEEEVEVELVTFPPVPPPQPVVVHVPEARSLMELNRRDVMLIAMGGAGVIGAVGLGYGLARLIRGFKSTDSETEEKP